MSLEGTWQGSTTAHRPALQLALVSSATLAVFLPSQSRPRWVWLDERSFNAQPTPISCGYPDEEETPRTISGSTLGQLLRRPVGSLFHSDPLCSPSPWLPLSLSGVYEEMSTVQRRCHPKEVSSPAGRTSFTPGPLPGSARMGYDC